MRSHGEAIASQARALVGARFRPQGRSREHGFDCIGVAAQALGLEAVPADYPMRGGLVEEVEGGLVEAGLRRVRAQRPGDLLLLRAGPQQLHLAVATDRGFVHADAGLRRVVETPGAPPWPLLGIWRARRSTWRR